jgi:hypothetical protein
MSVVHSSWPWSHRWLLGCVIACLVVGVALVVRSRSRGAGQPDAAVGSPNGALFAGHVLSVESANFAAGRWYLADLRGHRVHVLDSTGMLLQSVGRQGTGPGEFRAPSLIAASAERFYVAEHSRSAISVFDSSGVFVRLLSVRGACASGRVVGLAAVQRNLYVLRRCMELPARVVYQLERSLDGSPLQVWPVIGDTLRVAADAGVPLHLPVMAASLNRLVLGEGGSGCLRLFALPQGRPIGQRCLPEVARHPMPDAERERLTKRWQGRVVVPDSLPRIRGLALIDSALVVHGVTNAEQSTWLEIPWTAQPGRAVRILGRARVANSFLGPRTQLIVWDEAEGVRIELVPIER